MERLVEEWLLSFICTIKLPQSSVHGMIRHTVGFSVDYFLEVV